MGVGGYSILSSTIVLFSGLYRTRQLASPVKQIYSWDFGFVGEIKIDCAAQFSNTEHPDWELVELGSPFNARSPVYSALDHFPHFGDKRMGTNERPAVLLPWTFSIGEIKVRKTS